MEDWTADSDQPKVFSQQRVNDCDLCILLVAFRRGYVPDGSASSITQLEYEAAIRLGIDVLTFMLDEEAAWYRKYDERESDPMIKSWRSRLGESHGVEKFGLDPTSIDIGGALGRWLTKKGAQKNGDASPVRIQWPKEKSPYPGLLRFDQEYAPVFFGRDREVNELIAKMSEPTGRFIIVSGASGSGKSSLVDAGLWRALIEDNRMPGSCDWIWRRIQPGDGETPCLSLAWGLKEAFPKLKARPVELATGLADGRGKLDTILRGQMISGQTIVLFIDQLEELFTAGFGESAVQTFLETIAAATSIKDSRLRCVATVRSEFLGHLENIAITRELLNLGGGYHLGKVLPRDLQDMIEKPAEVTGYRFDPDLVQEILAESDEPGQLPLVAYALNELFKRREGGRLTKTAYDEIGGVAGAISTQAELAMGVLEEENRGAFDRVFAELVHVERDRPPTRKRAPIERFEGDVAATKLIDALADAECRVLVKDARAIEVAHEKLFTAWSGLSKWIGVQGEALRELDHAEEEARRWNKGKEPRDLWSSERISKVAEALKQFRKTRSDVLRCFMEPQAALVEQLSDDTLSHEKRALIGMKLAEYGDPRPGVGLRADGLPDILWSDSIDPGEVAIANHGKMSVVNPFRIAIYPVTNQQFEAFLNAPDGYTRDEWWPDLKPMEPESPSWSQANHPRETVSWYEAIAYCGWLTNAYRNAGLLESRAVIRLPTESEWQLAATRGDENREYPWQGGFVSARCNSYESRLNRTIAVGIYLAGASPYGVLDMAGNVWEWCLNEYANPKNVGTAGTDTRVLRGGSWFMFQLTCRSACRDGRDPGYRDDGVGFRVCCSLPIA